MSTKSSFNENSNFIESSHYGGIVKHQKQSVSREEEEVDIYADEFDISDNDEKNISQHLSKDCAL